MQTETGRNPSLPVPWFLCPESSGYIPLGPGIWAEVLVLPVLTGVPTLLGDKLSPGDICIWNAVVQDQLLKAHFFLCLLIILTTFIHSFIHSFIISFTA